MSEAVQGSGNFRYPKLWFCVIAYMVRSVHISVSFDLQISDLACRTCSHCANHKFYELYKSMYIFSAILSRRHYNKTLCKLLYNHSLAEISRPPIALAFELLLFH